LTAIFVALFRTALDVDRAAVRAFTTGRLLALAAWAVVAAGLVFYVSHFGAVNETYGGLGATLITLLWLTMLSVLYYVTPSMRLRGLGEFAPGLVVAVATALLGAALVAVAIAGSDPLASPGGALGALLLVVLWVAACNVALLHGVRLNLTVDGRDSVAPPEWRHVVEPGDGMSSSSTDDPDAAALAQMVAVALGDEIAHRGMWSVLPGGASEAPAVLSDLECDLNDWGFAYGVAWAVAKARFPLDDEDQTAERALEAATIVFRDYCGGADWSQRLATRREAGVLG